MLEWTVELGIDHADVGDVAIDDIVEALAACSPVVSVGERALRIRMSVEAVDAERAIKAARARLADALPADRRRFALVEVHAQEWERFCADLELPKAIALVGVAEVAQMLGVSRQRASQLARDPRFPEPMHVLAAGPVWAKAAIDLFQQGWQRKSGPKPRSAVPQGTTASTRRGRILRTGLGTDRGVYDIPDDFDAPLPTEIADAFGA